jgi:hypothetical protein
MRKTIYSPLLNKEGLGEVSPTTPVLQIKSKNPPH